MKDHRIFAAVYDLATAAAERGGLGALRRTLLEPLAGNVVEIGAGTGANLNHYGKLAHLTLVEPSASMREKLERKLAGLQPAYPVAVLPATLGNPETPLPLADASQDAVVSTLVLCSIDNVGEALRDIRRILRPGGQLVVLEHVRTSGAGGVVQDLLTPLQRTVAGGCRLNRDTRARLSQNGFDTSHLTCQALPGGIFPINTAIVGSAYVNSTLPEPTPAAPLQHGYTASD